MQLELSADNTIRHLRARQAANAELAERLRAQEQAQVAALYANGPEVFGLRFGASYREFTLCNLNNPGMDMMFRYPQVAATCFETWDKTLRFSKSEQPSWVNGFVRISLEQEAIVAMQFKTGDVPRALQAIDARFGPHRTSEVPMHDPGSQLCNAAGDCVVARPSQNWIDVFHEWDLEKLRVSVKMRKGSTEAEVVIRFKPEEQVRKLRAEIEAEIGREERERRERRERQF